MDFRAISFFLCFFLSEQLFFFLRTISNMYKSRCQLMSQIVFKQIPDVISSINIQQCLSLKGRDLKLFLKAEFTGSAWVWLPPEWAGAACPPSRSAGGLSLLPPS